jgi:hypothetical protein
MSPSFQAQGALVALNDREHRRRHQDERSGHGLAAMLTWQPFIH